MSINGCRPDSSKTLVARLAIFCLLGVSLRGERLPQTQRPSSSGHQIVMLLDVNADQKKVLPVELALAQGVIQKLDKPGNVFWLITFGSQPPALLKSGVQVDEAIAAIRGVSLERTSANYRSVQLYNALNLAFGQFIDDARPKSLLIITEGNDERRDMFKQGDSRAQRLHVMCNVAMVADHTFYGPKAIQRYGFYLRELARETHGLYVEVGGRQQKIPVAVDRLFNSVLAEHH